MKISIKKEIFSNKFYPLLKNQDRYLVLLGGGGSGKSFFASQKLLYRILSERDHRFLIVRKVAKTLRESVFQEMKRRISEWKLTSYFKFNETDMTITCTVNDNKILFAGLDDVEKLKSIQGITSIWIEEASEILESDFNQLDIRLRHKTKYYQQMIVTFNPINVNHWLKKRFFDSKIDSCTTLHSTYKDNPFLPDENKRVLEEFKVTDPYYYDVYALGRWGVLGKTIFPSAIVNNRIDELKEKPPAKRGFFAFDYVGDKIVDSSIKWVEDADGYISIYKDRNDRTPYVLGGDTAGDGSDYFGAHVIDNMSGEQVAVYHNQHDEDLFTRQMYCLGRYYNWAMIAIESNFSSFPIKELQRLGYRHQYTREAVDSYTNKTTKKYGFNTNGSNRPTIISNLVKLVRENIHLFHDKRTLEEMLTFVRSERGRPESQEGAHDDLIMSLAITHFVRNQQAQQYLYNVYQPKAFNPFETDTKEEGYISW